VHVNVSEHASPDLDELARAGMPTIEEKVTKSNAHMDSQADKP